MIKIVERNHMTKVIAKEYTEFLEQLKEQIATSRYKAALAVNSKLIVLYHHIGTEILKRQKEHGWGAKIIDQLSRDLRDVFPDMKGFSIQNLKYMRRFAEEYSENEIGQQAVDQLPWGHNIVIMYEVKIKKKDFGILKNHVNTAGLAISCLCKLKQTCINAKEKQSQILVISFRQLNQI